MYGDVAHSVSEELRRETGLGVETESTGVSHKSQMKTSM